MAPAESSNNTPLAANATNATNAAVVPQVAAGVPLTPRRMSISNRLSLQMPSRNPLSPILDPALGFSVARRPRLDFARSCTSLHHSTLATESSPESSPLATAHGYPIPRGRPLESPISSHHHHYPPSHASSIGSASMLDYASDNDSDSSTDEDLDGDMDMLDTPMSGGGFGGSGSFGTAFGGAGSFGGLSSGSAASTAESAATISLRNHQKARFGGRYPRRNTNRNRPMMTPSPIIQPKHHNLRSGAGAGTLTLGPSAFDTDESRPDPIRRPVSRRGSLLPKTKNFQRIKAALIEESAPVDLETKREAEITRQIREDDAPAQPLRSPEMREEDEEVMGGTALVHGMGISFSEQARENGGFWFGEMGEGMGDVMMHVDSPVSNSPIRPQKRRRGQDDGRFDQSVFKRRAVSPGGLSNHSPKLAQSPPNQQQHQGKRLNFQGFSDTHDGLMKMSLQ
ncbi:hypothetical protein FPQ18DRAFT_366071 [Pyronema domesticum]|nr:hypothetical protein FPQ18DRAFT_366071 [Pyronema domesticum]